MSNRKIETIAHDVRSAIKANIDDRIKIGKLLLEAREKIRSDKEFGKWLKDNLSDLIDQRTANRYLHLARCFSDKMPEGIPLSGLYKLSEPQNDDIRDGAHDGVLFSLDRLVDWIESGAIFGAVQQFVNQPLTTVFRIVLLQPPYEQHDLSAVR